MRFTTAFAVVLLFLAILGARFLASPSATPPSAVGHTAPTAATPGPPTAPQPKTTRSSTPTPPTLPPHAVVPPPATPGFTPFEHAFAAFDTWLRRPTTSPSTPSDLAASEAEGLRLALRRREELEDLIQSHPQRALELALPESVRATLPAQIAAVVEEQVSGRGDFEVLCALPEPGRESEVRPLQRYVVLEGRRFHAFVYGRRLTQPTLRDVSLHGIALGRLMAVAESPVREWPTAEAQSLLTAQPQALCAEGDDHPAANPLARVLEAYGKPALLCCPDHASRFEARVAAAGTGAADGFPLAASEATEGLKRLLFIRVDFSDLEGESFTTSRAADLTRELHRFYQENSYRRAGFFEIGSGSAVTPVFRMPRTAASYGSNDDAGDLRNDARAAARNAGYVLSEYDYDLTCMRSVPGFGWAGLGFVGAPGAWIRGTSSTGVTAHELGHNYGLNHANFWDTEGPTVTGPGESIEYGDKFDTMGAASAGNNHFNARYKRFLGWLQDSEYTVATTNGIYRVHAHDQTNAIAGSRGLQIFANSRTNYWVEFRQRFSANRWLFNGIGIRWSGRGNESSLLLDTTPDSPRDKDDAAVTLGRTFSDPTAAIHITPIAKGGTAPAWVDVAVQRGGFPDNRPPTLQLLAPTLEGTTTSTLDFQAVASDPDDDPLAYSWEFGDETLGSNTPQLTHRWSANGEFLVQCTASDMKGGIARASALVRIGAPSTLRLSGRITADGLPVAGVRVSTTTDRYTFTDSSGLYTLPGLNPGTYTLTATLDLTPFEPVSFSNPIQVQNSRTDLHFAAVDVAQRRPVTLLAAGSTWHYWDRGTSPGSTWFRPGFDDSTWNVGPAILGYGGDRETTVIDFGTNSSRKHITTWFRRAFVVQDPARLTQVRLGLLRDDGAAVYLNGTELFRDNLPAGTLTPQTLASSTVGGAAEVTYFERDVTLTRLVPGTNVLAVELHQASASSSDIAFDLRLTAEAVQTAEPGIRLVRPSPNETFRTPGRVVVSAAVGDLPSSPLRRVTFFADERVIGTATTAPFTITWLNPPPGDPTLTAQATLADGTTLASPPVNTSVRDANLNPTLVARGAHWRYLDTGVAPDASWTRAGFDDTAWLSGPARLGYGEDGEFTVVRFGSNPLLRHVTTWFRLAFDVVDASTVTNLACRLARDDGAVVYLNGQELFRSGMRTGLILPTLLAQSDVRDDAETTFAERIVAANALVEGPNVLAVEVHQASRSSSDMGFDLELVAQRSALPPAPRLGVRAGASGQRIFFWALKFADWRLEVSPGLGPDASWQPAPGAAVAQDSEYSQSLPSTDEPAFYRLARP